MWPHAPGAGSARCLRRVPVIRQFLPIIEVLTRPPYMSDVHVLDVNCPSVTEAKNGTRALSLATSCGFWKDIPAILSIGQQHWRKPSHQLWIINYESSTMNHQLWIINYESSTLNHQLWIELNRAANYGHQASTKRSRTRQSQVIEPLPIRRIHDLVLGRRWFIQLRTHCTAIWAMPIISLWSLVDARYATIFPFLF